MSAATLETAQTLQALATQLEVSLTSRQAQALLDYVERIAKWNAVYNLTAIRDPAQMIVQHVLDSLAIIPPLRRALRTEASSGADPVPSSSASRPDVSSDAGRDSSGNTSADLRIADVGSGPGLPGIVLAIAWPSADVTLIESSGKKAAFLRDCRARLGLERLAVFEGRVQAFEEMQDLVVCRAYAELRDFLRDSDRMIGDRTLVAAMKGQRPDAELARVPGAFETIDVMRLFVPRLQAERHLVLIRRRITADVSPRHDMSEGA